MNIQHACWAGVIALPAFFLSPVADTSSDFPSEPVVHENIVYGMHGGLALLMDVYRPAEANGSALLMIPGSGFHAPRGYDAEPMKDDETLAAIIQPCLDLGFTVFTINHRGAPIFRYPAPLEDVRRAARFVRHHAAEYGVTEKALAAVGLSSGGTMALMLGLQESEGDPDAEDPVERESASVDVVAALWSPTNFATMDWVGFAGVMFVTSYLGVPYAPGALDGPHEEASPITWVDADDPPVLLVHGAADRVVPVVQSFSLFETLRDVGVDVEYFTIPNRPHGLPIILDLDDPEALPSPRGIARWVEEHLPTGN